MTQHHRRIWGLLGLPPAFAGVDPTYAVAPAGDRVEDILRQHPQLTEADIHAAQAYAADYLSHESISAE